VGLAHARCVRRLERDGPYGRRPDRSARWLLRTRRGRRRTRSATDSERSREEGRSEPGKVPVALHRRLHSTRGGACNRRSPRRRGHDGKPPPGPYKTATKRQGRPTGGARKRRQPPPGPRVACRLSGTLR
jgi:hypothetical protein